ncbi:hypothetical protein DKL61_09695 [Gammaproteobacteria bacterium ESL0073]|nr:hypothetical protein DKL61_09695 [Gammaproteobacteria bacterium ESL0073]
MEIILSSLLLLIGLFVSVMNWLIFFNNDILKKKHSSFGLLIGGILLCIGILTMPFPSINEYWYLAFFIDFGCIPCLVIGVSYKIIKIFK